MVHQRSTLSSHGEAIEDLKHSSTQALETWQAIAHCQQPDKDTNQEDSPLSAASAANNNAASSAKRSMAEMAAAAAASEGSFTEVKRNTKNSTSHQRRHRKPIVGTREGHDNQRLRGAPEPSRDAFVYRVEKGAEADDITEHLAENNIEARKVVKMSKDKAAFCSFRVEVKVSDLSSLLNEDLWPEGVRVRRFYPAKKTATTSSRDSDQTSQKCIG